MVVKHISQNCSISLSFGVNETISETHHLATSIATMLRGSPMICGDRHMHSRPRLHGCPRSRITSELCSWSYLIPVFFVYQKSKSQVVIFEDFFWRTALETFWRWCWGDVRKSFTPETCFISVHWLAVFIPNHSIETVPTSIGWGNFVDLVRVDFLRTYHRLRKMKQTYFWPNYNISLAIFSLK